MAKTVSGEVTSIEIDKGKSRRGGNWKKYTLELDDDKKYGGFYGNDDDLDEFFDEVEEGNEVELEIKKAGKYYNIISGEITEGGDDEKPKKKKKSKKSRDDDDDDEEEEKPRKKAKKGGKKSDGGQGWQVEDTRRVVYMHSLDKAKALVDTALEKEMLSVGSKKANKFDNYIALIEEQARRITAFALTTATEESFAADYEPKDVEEEEEEE